MRNDLNNIGVNSLGCNNYFLDPLKEIYNAISMPLDKSNINYTQILYRLFIWYLFMDKGLKGIQRLVAH